MYCLLISDFIVPQPEKESMHPVDKKSVRIFRNTKNTRQWGVFCIVQCILLSFI